jgi:hypothetical protein
MAYTARHGRRARIYIDASTAGTMAVGTSTLTLLEGRRSWNFDQSTDFPDTTSFGDTSKTSVAGLPNANGAIGGNWDSAGSGTLIKNIIGSTVERGIMIFPDWDNNLTTYISGKAFFSVTTQADVDSPVTQDITFSAGPTGITWTTP